MRRRGNTRILKAYGIAALNSIVWQERDKKLDKSREICYKGNGNAIVKGGREVK